MKLNFSQFLSKETISDIAYNKKLNDVAEVLSIRMQKDKGSRAEMAEMLAKIFLFHDSSNLSESNLCDIMQIHHDIDDVYCDGGQFSTKYIKDLPMKELAKAINPELEIHASDLTYKIFQTMEKMDDGEGEEFLIETIWSLYYICLLHEVDPEEASNIFINDHVNIDTK